MKVDHLKWIRSRSMDWAMIQSISENRPLSDTFAMNFPALTPEGSKMASNSVFVVIQGYTQVVKR